MFQETNDEYDLEIKRVSRMIKAHDYFDFDINPGGKGIQHNYQHVNSDVIEDRATGLLWQRGGSENMLTIKNTVEYIKELNQNNLAGFSDWRLPTLSEALGLVESKRNKDGLYLDLIFDQKPFCLWTDDTFKTNGETRKWFVNFVIGGCFELDITSSCCVRLVRSQSVFKKTVNEKDNPT